MGKFHQNTKVNKSNAATAWYPLIDGIQQNKNFDISLNLS